MVNNLLENKKGIIFGALDDHSIAWKAAEKIKSSGGKFTLSNTPIAIKMGKINELAQQCNTTVIPADVTSIEDLERVIAQSISLLGGKLDFVLHSVGMSPNIRKKKPYHDLNYDFMFKTMDVSAISFHKIMNVIEKQDAMNTWGSILALSYIAAQRTFPDYSDMAQAKAMLESIARSYGYHLGKTKKIRVNTISQSPTKTTAGKGVQGFDNFFDFTNHMSPLGNPSAEDCANYIVLMFSDLSRMVTMQNLMHDGGFSSTGITEEVMNANSTA